MKITIPASLTEAKASLGGIGALLKAKEWERAAIVYAFTDPKVNQHDGNPSGSLSIAAFAAFGITGLTRRETVAGYRKAWQSAIDDGQAVPVAPGDVIELPNLPWPPGFIDHKRGSHATKNEMVDGFREMVEDDAKQTIDSVMEGHPTLASKLVDGILANPMTRVTVEARLAEPPVERQSHPRPPAEHDHGTDLRRAVGLLLPVLYAIQRGEWTANANQELLLHALGLLLAELPQPTGTQDDLFSQIEEYLNATRREA